MSVWAVVALAGLGGCKETKPTPTPEPGGEVQATRTALLGAFGACVVTSARDFQQVAAELETATAALAAQPGDSTRNAARAAYHRAMDAWQILETMQVGPAAPRSMPGGAELRDNIYSWPLVSRCAIEEQLVSRSYESQDFPNSLISRRGLYAVEYLLFYEGTDTACGPTSPIVSGGTWAALSTEEKQARKRAYAAAAAEDVHRRAVQLTEAWEPGKGDFAKTLETAGPGNTVYATSQAGLNSVSDALFYVEQTVKDTKLARPLGLRDCDGDTCPEYLESQFAARSKANVRSNLVGYRRVMEGCGPDFSGVAFDDLLVAVGSEALATKLHERGAAAQAALEAVNESDLVQALDQDKASVRALYDGVKGMTDVLKTELVTVLDLELPQTVEGDND
ncbi:imelysin family protein [Hyalangium rubrum]|uniref:Imelysin family protein n=1 Tax=Hyalangium rubrum TaxID=3103134 RepID=A0ABU5H1G7_9BACT|nr:imelysin family protein [Hyalangium sp. s54d21]MDY7226617.1 imelysin family protein [Hyalangium sp. s54d21]